MANFRQTCQWTQHRCLAKVLQPAINRKSKPSGSPFWHWTSERLIKSVKSTNGSQEPSLNCHRISVIWPIPYFLSFALKKAVVQRNAHKFCLLTLSAPNVNLWNAMLAVTAKRTVSKCYDRAAQLINPELKNQGDGCSSLPFCSASLAMQVLQTKLQSKCCHASPLHPLPCTDFPEQKLMRKEKKRKGAGS